MFSRTRIFPFFLGVLTFLDFPLSPWCSCAPDFPFVSLMFPHARFFPIPLVFPSANSMQMFYFSFKIFLTSQHPYLHVYFRQNICRFNIARLSMILGNLSIYLFYTKLTCHKSFDFPPFRFFQWQVVIKNWIKLYPSLKWWPPSTRSVIIKKARKLRHYHLR